ncbi:MAG: NAD(P)H-dependent oxidoreductase [Verrucomicrobiae bacterium]|nr:NAD(P)H-dependent oxidoreductase [Verrucomicrobiae bacterium]
MKISVILAHPKSGSFNHALAARIVKTLQQPGHEVFFHDLYAEQFAPVLPEQELAKGSSLPPEIKRYCDEILASDGIVIIHPNWWGQPPAILKGWVDRVLKQGIVYEFRQGVGVGMLKARAIVINTSNTPEKDELEMYGDPLETLWKRCIFGLCGVKHVVRRNLTSVIMSSGEQRKAWLDEVEKLARSEFPASS